MRDVPLRPPARLSAGVAVVVVSVNLRPGAAGVGPVLAELRAGLGVGGGYAGLLNGLPGLCFAVAGALAVGLARRIGTAAGIALGLVAAAAGLLLRATTGSAWLFLLLSTLALAGMAVGNVLVPAWIKRFGGHRQVALATLYGTGLVVGGTLGSLLTAPLAESLGGWDRALGAWALPILLALPLWLRLAARERRDRGPATVARSGSVLPLGVAASPTAVAMTLLFGLQSMHAYVQMGWLPQVYRDAGLSAVQAGGLQALLAATSIVGSLAMPTVIVRAPSLAPYMMTFGVLLASGYTGLVLAPAEVPWLWALMLGVAGFAFPLVIALLPARTHDPDVTARLSGFVQPVGYLAAAAGPVLVGMLHDATGGWTAVLVLLGATAVPFTLAGLRAVRPVLVDDELADAGRRHE
ncbi:MFS transporter [Nocardioides solisilvae]|uniref:MFS transporter n=1 Tax=Nocardioides solisilvae TaxID=1542435 RepID=UPI000D74F102|nr:MFS transporter [Nocardioides solisilvae]